MSVIQIPGGTATLRDKLVSERHHRILEAAYTSATSAIAKSRDAFLAVAAARLGISDTSNLTQAQLDEAQKVIDDLSDEETARIQNGVHLTQEEAASMLDLRDAGIVAFLENWSLKRPLPTVATVQDLDRELYQPLAEATAPLATRAVLGTTDFSVTPNKDDGSPTKGSDSSDTPSGDEAQETSPSTSPTSGESTNSVV